MRTCAGAYVHARRTRFRDKDFKEKEPKCASARVCARTQATGRQFHSFSRFEKKCNYLTPMTGDMSSHRSARLHLSPPASPHRECHALNSDSSSLSSFASSFATESEGMVEMNTMDFRCSSSLGSKSEESTAGRCVSAHLHQERS